MFFEYELLNIHRIRQLMGYFETAEWIRSQSGPKSFTRRGNMHTKVKECWTLEDIHQREDVQLISRKVFEDINSTDIRADLLIDDANPPTFLKYDMGDYYDWHVDSYIMNGIRADYSVTIFLNDNYEGGELVLDLGTEKIEKKCKPGTAFIYPTNFAHKINPVTSGSRYVIVLWMSSLVRDITVRQSAIELTSFIKKYENELTYSQKMEIEKTRTTLIRNFGDFV
jgi:predicted 2-oxoglutarate/Fe(II)-dependent dioxygenase YbiX